MSGCGWKAYSSTETPGKVCSVHCHVRVGGTAPLGYEDGGSCAEPPKGSGGGGETPLICWETKPQTLSRAKSCGEGKLQDGTGREGGQSGSTGWDAGQGGWERGAARAAPSMGNVNGSPPKKVNPERNVNGDTNGDIKGSPPKK